MRDFENLGAYLPAIVLKQLVEGQFDVPQEQQFKTVCLFADVSGFTVLSEKLCAEGQDGIEELAAQLNKYMAQVVKLTSRAGGDVLKFAGDALISIFTDESGDLTPALLRAIQCSLDMQLRLTDFGFSFRKTDSEGNDMLGAKLVKGELNIKLGIGIGNASMLYVGGESDNVMPERYEYVAIGPALQEAFASEGAAVKGQVVISQSAYELISQKIICEPLPDGQHFLVKSVLKSEELTWKKKEELASFAPTDEIEANIWRCVPAAVLPYLNESNEFWAPELRRVTTLFVNLGFTEKDMEQVDMSALHNTYRAMQECVFQFEGTINKFLCDDKGSTLLVVFGLPPFAHENDTTRGVLAAMSILTKLKEFGREGSVGITTGMAFCGVVGTRGNRREYSVIGDVVNVSARLMSESGKQKCGHLMDKASHRAIESDGLRTIYYTSVHLKGKAYDIPVYQVAGEMDNAPFNAQSSSALLVSAQAPVTSKRSFKTSASKKKLATTNRPSLGQPQSPLAEEASEAQKLAAANPANVKLQVSAITEAPKLKAIREVALQRLFDEREKAGVLDKALSSFAKASEKGLKMGSGRARTKEELATKSVVSPPPVSINPHRALKAAQITFESCSTAAESQSLSTVFTLPLVTGIETMYDLKDAALTRLGNRQLLSKGPQADRAYFSLRWNEAGKDESVIKDENALLDSFSERNMPIIKLALVEHASKRPESSKRSKAMSVSTANTPRNIMEVAKLRVLAHDSPCGSLIILEGTQGVGKTYLAEEVFLRGDIVSSALSAVAMGNPYELELATSMLNVWTVILRQLLEETLVFREMAPNDVPRLLQIAKQAICAVDSAFADFDALNDLCEHALDTGRLPPALLDQLATSMQPEAAVTITVQTIAKLVAGLSLTYLPIVVVIDDSHFMDLASWQVVDSLLTLIDETQARIILLLLHRNIIHAETFATKIPEEGEPVSQAIVGHNNMRALENKFTKTRRAVEKLYGGLLNRPHVAFVEQKSEAEDTKNIVQDRLGVDNVDSLSPLVDFLKVKTQGNRLFINSFLDDVLDAELITFTGRTAQLSDEFMNKLKYHELPLPVNVEGICSTLLDSTSITQQMALKVAAIIGKSFSLELVTSIFPIAHLRPTLAGEWAILVRLGVVVELPLQTRSEILYTFYNPWMLETLRKRMLFKQRRKLNELYKSYIQEKEREVNQRFLESSMNKLSVKHSGYLMVKKENGRNVLQPWKKRWVVLEGDELIQYYEENNTVRKLEVVKLSSPGTTVTNKVGGFTELVQGDGVFPYCFVVHATTWIKKDQIQKRLRDFYLAPETEAEHREWVFRIGFQLDLFRVKSAEDSKRNIEAQRALVGRMDDISAVAGIAAEGKPNAAAAAAAPLPLARDKSSAAAARPQSSEREQSTASKFLSKISRPSLHMAMVKSRPKSQVPSGVSPNKLRPISNGGLLSEYSNPGKEVRIMSAANFKAISRDEVLSTFWSTEETSFDEVMVVRSGHHISFFYELGDMALVSINGNEAMDGYLLGFVSSRSPDVAVLHQIAVLPMVRRHGIATRLVEFFFDLAKQRGCQTVRALVPKDAHGARAFHQKMGFDLNPEEALLDGLDLNVFTLPLYKLSAQSEVNTFGDDEEEEED